MSADHVPNETHHPHMQAGAQRGVPPTDQGVQAIPSGLGTPSRGSAGWSDPRTDAALDPRWHGQPTANHNEIIDRSLRSKNRYYI
jgi:hypothetical protein